MGMIRSNQSNLVRTTTSSAYSSLASLDNSFPKASLETLEKSLRGVGPATASLILSVIPPMTATIKFPFTATSSSPGSVSNDILHWGASSKQTRAQICRLKFSKGKWGKSAPVKPKYTINEYRQLYDAMREVRERLNRPNEDPDKKSETHAVSAVDIEKAAFVIGHLDVSGYSESKNPATEEQHPEAKDATPKQEETAAVPDIRDDKAKGGSKKRKR
jgi:hypothetical protein